MPMPPELVRLWQEAEANPGTKIPVGRNVFCDFCDEDFTDSPASGGFIFESKAACPACAPRLRASAKKYGEERFIRASCPEGVAFADFVRQYRGPDAFLRVSR